MTARFRSLTLLLSVLALAGCPGPSEVDGGSDAPQDGGIRDGGRDAGRDASVDAAELDAIDLDAAMTDDASDASVPVDGGCTAAAECEDGDACTLDTCDSGSCVSAPVDIDDSDACTVDACDSATGVTHTPASVDDADVCTADACDASTGISHTPIADCCVEASECPSGVCDANMCRPAACGDLVQNGTETDVDCGGADCGPCALGLACGGNGDCDSDACVGGVCVECLSPTTCPGTDSECQSRTCTTGVCGISFEAAGTVTTSQTAGDCRENQCDGAGNITGAIANSDLPVDGNQCTSDVCTAGAPSNPASASGDVCSQSGGSVCDGAGACVECVSASTCPGSDTECASRTCAAGVCGISFTAAGTTTATQTAGDCRENQCDGAGNINNAIANSDLPVDGNQCTSDVCIAGAPSNPPSASGAVCSQSGGTVCDGAGACVACVSASTCPGTDTECASRTCTAGACGMSFAAAGTATATQTTGDCRQNECDGAGNITGAVANGDLPIDGNQCTDDVCTAGVPSNPPSPSGSVCAQAGGVLCDGASSCVECASATDCPGSDTACQTRTCSAGICGLSLASAGTVIAAQTAGDCQANECDGGGNIVSVAANADVPVDGNQCTGDVCTAGVPSNPLEPLGTACNQSGGTVCDGLGTCASAPTVTSTTPGDATSAVASTAIAVTFSAAMNPASLTGQTTAGACTGSVQVSLDDFTTCIALGSNAAAMSGGNTIATFNATPGLLVNRTYRIRVTTVAASAAGFSLAATYSSATGFMTGSPDLCGDSVVIAQVYGGGGNSGAPWTHDFVVLHNRGGSTVSLAGWSVQYAGAMGSSWSVAALTGSIAPSGFYLVQLAGGATGSALPTPDATSGSVNLSGTNGKVALLSSTTALTVSCPTGGALEDFVGFGTANCFEGSAAPAASNSTALVRGSNSCGDLNDNALDFSTAAPVPVNSSSAASVCGCSAVNESDSATEADYCVVQFPTSLTVAPGMTSGNIYGQLFEAGVTEPAGADASVRAQLGYGPPTANPEYESGWSWTNATYNVQAGNNDEYQAAFTAPAAGDYRYAYRFSLDGGVHWTTCDTDGAGSNAGLTFDFASEPVLTVTP